MCISREGLLWEKKGTIGPPTRVVVAGGLCVGGGGGGWGEGHVILDRWVGVPLLRNDGGKGGGPRKSEGNFNIRSIPRES